jgi:hypothetical protein
MLSRTWLRVAQPLRGGGDEWACLPASHPSAQNAERMGHPDFICDLNRRLEWVGHPTHEPADIKLIRLPPLAKKPQGAGHPKPEFSSVKVRATRRALCGQSDREG